MERDAGFCSGGDEDDMEAEDDLHSPTDASEDSIDVKVRAISLKNKNKRKCAEPRRVEMPAKKRKIDNNLTFKNSNNSDSSPFRPWSRSPIPPNHSSFKIDKGSLLRPCTPSECHTSPPIPFTVRSQDEPLSLVKRVSKSVQRTWHRPVLDVRNPNNCVNEDLSEKQEQKLKHGSDEKFKIETLLSGSVVKSEYSEESQDNQRKSSHGSTNQQRNYKNMTRERRIEANARERTRVHTISAAFDTLRHSVPAYSHNQKLSKLSVLRIACSYIMTLSRLAGYDYSNEQNEPELSECIDNVSKTIQTEGKLRKKKDD